MQQIWDLLDPADNTPLPLPLVSAPSERAGADHDVSKPWYIQSSARRDRLIDLSRTLSQQFLITPIPQHYRHYHYPLLYFTGILGIHPSSLAYRTAYQFTPILAGLLWVSRLLILQYADESPADDSGGGSDTQSMEHFRSIQARYLCRESPSSTSHILRFLAFGRQLAQNEGPRTNIT